MNLHPFHKWHGRTDKFSSSSIQLPSLNSRNAMYGDLPTNSSKWLYSHLSINRKGQSFCYGFYGTGLVIDVYNVCFRQNYGILFNHIWPVLAVALFLSSRRRISISSVSLSPEGCLSLIPCIHMS